MFRLLARLSAQNLSPRSDCPGASLRNWFELKTQYLVATSRTSGRTSPPNTGIPVTVTRHLIPMSV